jgi:multiple sugar transport system substrate-binding protein
MATIKEVAKLANVSLGTVSNVLNGKTQNEELIQRVEAAMEQLSYRPDANARSLKNTRSGVIGVILPDVLQNDLADFLLELERLLKEKGYHILVKFSRNNRLVEKQCIEAFLEQCVDGIVLYSVLRKKPITMLEKSKVPAVIISRSAEEEFAGDKIIIDYSKAFTQAVKDCVDRSWKRVALILEKDLLQEADLAGIYHQFYPENDLIKVVDGSQERGFQAFFQLYTADPSLDCVFAGSATIAKGVKRAMEILDAPDIPVIVMKESSWMEDAGCFAAQLTVSPKLMAQKTADRLLEAVRKPHLHENITTVLQGIYDKIEPATAGITKAEHDLRFAMYDCSSSRSLQMLSKIYEKESGRKVIFDFFSYKELEELLYQKSEEKDSYYDGFMMDITWLEGLIESGGVKNLDELFADNKAFFDGFIDGVVKEYGMYVESLYAVPFMSGALLLFYQKDLFENRTLQMRFKRKYKEDLLPPQTWAQFNLIAEFFTKECNPQSPVTYGASLPRGENVYTTISFLCHLWSYGSRVFDERGEVSINDSNAVAALKNFALSYQYSSGKQLYSWNEVADEFARGNSAMVILYDSDAGDINNYTKSKVAGNIGYAQIPGGTPVLGGWSLGLNRYGEHPEDAQNFLMWACGNQNGIPLSLLGGSTLRKEYYKRADLENLEPWKGLILKCYEQSKKRFMPEILDESRWKNNIYTSLIPKEIERVLQGEANEQEALKRMEENIRRLLEG